MSYLKELKNGLSILNFNFNRIARLKFMWILTGVFISLIVIIDSIITCAVIRNNNYFPGYELLVTMHVIFSFIYLAIFHFWNLNHFYSLDYKNGIHNLELRCGIKKSTIIGFKILFNLIITNAFILISIMLNAIIMAAANFAGSALYFKEFFAGLFLLVVMNIGFFSIAFLCFNVIQNSLIMIVPSLFVGLQIVFPVLTQTIASKAFHPSNRVMDSQRLIVLKDLIDIEKKYDKGLVQTLFSEYKKNYSYYHFEKENPDMHKFIDITGLIFEVPNYFKDEYGKATIDDDFSKSKLFSFLKIMYQSKFDASEYKESWFSGNTYNGYESNNQLLDSLNNMSEDEFVNQLISNDVINKSVSTSNLKNEIKDVISLFDKWYSIEYMYDSNKANGQEEGMLSTKVQEVSFGNRMILKMFGDIINYSKTLNDDKVEPNPAASWLLYGAPPILNYSGILLYSHPRDDMFDLYFGDHTMQGSVGTSVTVTKNNSFPEHLEIKVEKNKVMVPVAYLTNIVVSSLFLGLGYLACYKRKKG